MQNLSFFDSKGVSLAASYLDSCVNSSFVLRWRTKRKRSPFGRSNCCGFSSQNQMLIHGFLSLGSRVDIWGPKFASFGRPLALALVLDNGNQAEQLDEVDNRNDTDELIIDKEKIDVRALGSSLRDAKTAHDVEELMKNLDDLPLPVYSSIIRGFGFEKKLDPAFALVEWLKRKKRMTNGSVGPNLYIYNSLLGAIKQVGQFEKIDGVIEEMMSQGIVPNIVTHNTMMSLHLEQGRPGDALKVFDDIVKNGLSPSPVTYSTILLAYRKMEDASGAIEFFVQFREKYEKQDIRRGNKEYDWDIEFDKLQKFTIRICYLLMRQFLVKDDNPSINVFKVLSGMDKARIKPGQKEYERLIWACTYEGHYNVAKELYGRIREMESEISLSVCNHVIWLMGKAKKWWAALEIYEDLLDKGPMPNNLSHELILSHFNFLLSAARRKGIWRWGVRLINKMLEKGLRPGTREWNAVLVACSKASETSAAVQIFRRMVEQGEKPTVLSYGALLSALEKGKLYDEALKVWEHMCKVGVKPNLHAYTILASIYIGKGKPEMVDSVLWEMSYAKIEPTVVTFNAIITGYAKNQMGGSAFEWFHRMKVQNIRPNEITYNMLIEALACDGKPRLAYDMYLRALDEGMLPSARAYDAIMESCRVDNTSLNMNALGPRPLEKKRNLKFRKKLSEFCNLADVPRRSKPFDNTEFYNSRIQGRLWPRWI